jgi:hypothetical protein
VEGKHRSHLKRYKGYKERERERERKIQREGEGKNERERWSERLVQ